MAAAADEGRTLHTGHVTYGLGKVLPEAGTSQTAANVQNARM